MSDVSRHALDSGSGGGRCGYQGFPLQIAPFTTDARRKSGRRAGHVFTDRRENDDAESAYRLPRTSIGDADGSGDLPELHGSDAYSTVIRELLVRRILRRL